MNEEQKTKVEVTKVTVKIGKKELTLSLDEAKQLRDELSKALGDVRYYPSWPTVIYQQPPQVYSPTIYPLKYEAWCGSNQAYGWSGNGPTQFAGMLSMDVK